jgi:ATP-binding cassette subfamily F protein 3
LNELQKAPMLFSSTTTTVAEPTAASENKLSYEAQKELAKKLKKQERLVADCEAGIDQIESAVAILESRMATTEGASDMALYEQHQKLKQQLDQTVEEWEKRTLELEEMRTN